MIRRNNLLPRRHATTVVEFALVGPLVLFLIFGCLEWCLYMFALNQAQNAAREGARFAVVRTDTYQSFYSETHDGTGQPLDPVPAGQNTQQAVKNFVQNYLNNVGAQVTPPVIWIYKVNDQGQPIGTDGAPLTHAQAIDPLNQGKWNETAFGQRISLTITSNYIPFLPGVSKIGLTPPVNATADMGSEGN